MASQLPVRKYVKVWIKKRKNNPLKDGSRTTSYTLEWVEYGQRRFLSLGKHATAAYARQAASDQENESSCSFWTPERMKIACKHAVTLKGVFGINL
jgi:hypothetical protein